MKLWGCKSREFCQRKYETHFIYDYTVFRPTRFYQTYRFGMSEKRWSERCSIYYGDSKAKKHYRCFKLNCGDSKVVNAARSIFSYMKYRIYETLSIYDYI